MLQAGLNRFTDLNTTERARLLGARRVIKSAALRRMIYANLRASAQTPVSAMEAASAALPTADVSAANLPDVPDWSAALPDVKDQGKHSTS